MPFTFPTDSNNKAGAVKSIRGNTDFVVPVTDVSGAAALLTNTPLAGNASYTQATQSRLAELLVTKIKGYAFADQAGTLYIEEADVDGVWTQTKTLAVVANVFADTGWIYLTKKLFRFRYVNGATIQTVFSMYQAVGFGVADVQLTGSNFEQTPGSVAPSKAVQIGGTDGTNLQRARVDGFNNLAVVIRNGVDQANMPDGSADGITTASRGVQVFSGGLGLNGATWDRWRNNTEGTLLASAARTTSTAGPISTNYNGNRLNLILDVTANPGGAENLVVYIQGIDPASGSSYNIVAFPAVSPALNARYVYVLGPGDVETIATANLEVQGLHLPRTWRAYIEHVGAGSWTYSLGYHLNV